MAARNEIKQYVSKQIMEQRNILRLYSFDDNDTPFPKRYLFKDIEQYITGFFQHRREPRWLIIAGLGGVGKTTLLAQIFFHMEQQLKKRILYVSADVIVNKLNSNLYEVINAYEEIIGSSLSTLKENTLLLIDEVHYDEKWAFSLKYVYDTSKKVFIVSTGSSAISLNINTDVARRSLTEKMYPLNFTEYATLSSALNEKSFIVKPPDKLSENLKDIIFHSDNPLTIYTELRSIEMEILSYWQSIDPLRISKYLKYYSMPSVLLYSDETKIYQNLNKVIDRIIDKDITLLKIFSREILAKIHSLLFMLSSCDVASLHSFAKNLSIEIKTISSIFDTLEKAELIFRIYPFGSAFKKVRKPSKYLFSASCLRAALLSIIDSNAIEITHKGKLLEDAVGLFLIRQFERKVGKSVTYDTSEAGADFIININKKKIVIEVGWNKSSSSQISRTMKRINGDYGILITQSALGFDKKENIITLPLQYFFLM